MIDQKLQIEITLDHVNIWQENDGKIKPVAHWHKDEWEEDPITVLPAIQAAISLFITNQKKLLEILGFANLILNKSMENFNELIPKIKAIIAEWGSVFTGQLSLDCSPCYTNVGNLSSLVERFNAHDVDIISYDNDGNEIDSFLLTYEELDNSLLEEIFEILQDYDTDMEKTMNRCKDNNY